MMKHFVILICLFLSTMENTGRLEFCNCGHNAPIVGCGSQKAHFLEMECNVVIGLFPDIEFVGEVMEDIRNTMLFGTIPKRPLTKRRILSRSSLATIACWKSCSNTPIALPTN